MSNQDNHHDAVEAMVDTAPLAPAAPDAGQSDSASYGVGSKHDYDRAEDQSDPVLTRKDEPSPLERWNTNVEDWTARIKVKWDKVQESSVALRASIFDLGTELAEAKKRLSYAAFKTVIAKSGVWSLSTADNYIRVAKAGHLRLSEFQAHLPMGVGVLIDLAAWDAASIKKCIAQGYMHPAATRTNLRES